MTLRARHREEFLTFGCLVPINLPEAVLAPLRRLQTPQSDLDFVQVIHLRGCVESVFRWDGPAVSVQEARFRSDPQRFAKVPGHRLPYRGVVLHVIEFPDVPHWGIANGSIANAVIGGAQFIAEHGISDAGECVSSPNSLYRGIQRMERLVVVPRLFQEHADLRAQVAMQLPKTVGVCRAQYPHGKTRELERVKIGRGKRSQQFQSEVAGLGGGEGVHGSSAIDTHSISLAVLVDD